MLTSDEKLKKMIIEEAISLLEEAEKPGWLQHRLNALRARDWRRAGAGSMRDVQRGREGFQAAPGGSLSGYDPRPGLGGAVADVFNPRMRAPAPEETAPEEEMAPETAADMAPEEVWYTREGDIESLAPEDPTAERPPPLPIEALAQRKDVIVLPKSTVKLKKILNDLMEDAVNYAGGQNPELGDEIMAGSAALKGEKLNKISSTTGAIYRGPSAEGDLSAFWRFRDSMVMGLLRGLRNLNVGQYLKENINDFVYIEESRLKQMLYDILKEGL